MESYDEIWDELHTNKEWGKYPAEHIIRFVARNYYNEVKRENIKILDFGCGNGSHTWYLAREGFSVYAFDGAEIVINRLKDRMKKENLYADIKKMDACQLDYPDDFFDCVIDNLCIYANRIDAIRYMYSSIYSMLKPNGKIFTNVFSTDCTGYGTGKELEHNTFIDVEKGCTKGGGTTHFFDYDEIYEIINHCGFRNIKIDKSVITDNGNVISNYWVQGTKLVL